MLTFISDIFAKTKFVKASATVNLAPFRLSMRHFIGCSPIEVAPPTVLKCDKATTPTSANGVCSGPTHCCCATKPVTDRST